MGNAYLILQRGPGEGGRSGKPHMPPTLYHLPQVSELITRARCPRDSEG